MAKSYHNIHDIFVRESFSDAERAIAFFERFLPETMVKYFNLKSLTVLNDTYINETLKEHFSDLVFEVSLKSDNLVKTDVVLLFERILRLLPIEGANRNFLEMIVVYALNVSEITEAQLGETLKSIPEPLKDKIMTTYTMLIEKGKIEGKLEGKVEGEQIGIQKGIEKGKLEEKSEVILSLFDEGFETPRIAKIVKLPEEEVVKVLKDKGRLK